MTGIDAYHLLFKFFLENDSLKYSDINSLVIKSKNTKENSGEIAAVLCALEDLTLNNILFKNQDDLGNQKTTVWVLRKPLTLLQQTVILDGAIAFRIAEVINMFCETVEEELIANPFNISQNEIQGLLDIITLYAEKNKEIKEKK